MKFNLFKNNIEPKIIRTDPNMAPKLRLAEILNTKFEKEGYRFLKSKNEFVFDFEYGKKVIRLSYNSSMGYISQVDCFIYFVFKDIESDFKKVIPEYGWTNWTLCRSVYWDSGWLCNEESGNYTDESINKVAQKFFNELMPKIDIEFSKANNYKDLKNLFLNKQDTDKLVDWLRPEKKAILRLILCKAFEPDSFSQYSKTEIDQIGRYKGQDKSEILAEIEKAINYLKSNEKLKTISAKLKITT